MVDPNEASGARVGILAFILLRDVVSDLTAYLAQGGAFEPSALQRVRSRFDARFAQIYADCSDADRRALLEDAVRLVGGVLAETDAAAGRAVMRGLWRHRSYWGEFLIRPERDGRWHAVFREESLGAYPDPIAALAALVDGRTAWPSNGLNPVAASLPRALGQWEFVRNV